MLVPQIPTLPPYRAERPYRQRSVSSPYLTTYLLLSGFLGVSSTLVRAGSTNTTATNKPRGDKVKSRAIIRAVQGGALLIEDRRPGTSLNHAPASSPA